MLLSKGGVWKQQRIRNGAPKEIRTPDPQIRSNNTRRRFSLLHKSAAPALWLKERAIVAFLDVLSRAGLHPLPWMNLVTLHAVGPDGTMHEGLMTSSVGPWRNTGLCRNSAVGRPAVLNCSSSH